MSVFFFSLFTSIINKVINNQAQGVDSRHDCDFKNNNRPVENILIKKKMFWYFFQCLFIFHYYSCLINFAYFSASVLFVAEKEAFCYFDLEAIAGIRKAK